MLKIRIDRRAVPQPRHRATRGGRMYLPTSAPVRAFKAAIRERALAAITTPMPGPVRVTVACTFRRPPSHLGRGGRPRPAAPMAPGRNLGDVDNLAKAVLDALSGVAFLDDSQVVELVTSKAWDRSDQTLVTVEPIGALCHAGTR